MKQEIVNKILKAPVENDSTIEDHLSWLAHDIEMIIEKIKKVEEPSLLKESALTCLNTASWEINSAKKHLTK